MSFDIEAILPIEPISVKQSSPIGCPDFESFSPLATTAGFEARLENGLTFPLGGAKII